MDARKTYKRHPAASGGKWIRQDKRLAIYLRDGLSCVWCGTSVEDGVSLSLDHVQPHSCGGSNHESNLVTACRKCNSTRQDRSAESFAGAVAGYVNAGATASAILSDIADRTSQDLRPFRAEAKQLIARRGTSAKVIASMENGR